MIIASVDALSSGQSKKVSDIAPKVVWRDFDMIDFGFGCVCDDIGTDYD